VIHSVEGLAQVGPCKRKLDMPIFEYKCQQCGHVMEVLQKSRKATKQTCSKCGGSDMKRLLSGFSVGQSRASSSPPCYSCPSPGTCGGSYCPSGTCPME
jgi:putative FmdB family regulatory protein